MRRSENKDCDARLQLLHQPGCAARSRNDRPCRIDMQKKIRFKDRRANRKSSSTIESRPYEARDPIVVLMRLLPGSLRPLDKPARLCAAETPYRDNDGQLLHRTQQ
jgi:hypothetical protein